MPSAFSGRYQSRFFNFVHQQSRRLSDTFERTLRHLQVATIWSFKALMYSVLVLLQIDAEPVDRQVRAGEQQRRLHLQGHNTDSQPEPTASADTDLQQVLGAKNKTELFAEIDCLLTKLTENKDKIAIIPDKTRGEDTIESRYLLTFSPVLAFLDFSLAKLESNALVPMSRATTLVQQRSSSLFQVVQTQFKIFLYGKQQPIKSTEGALAVDNLENQPLNIQALIWAALNYFFGVGVARRRHRTHKKVKQSTPANGVYQIPVSPARKSHDQALPPRPHFQALSEADPWLRMSDLFGHSLEVSEVANEQQLVASSPATNPSVLTSPSFVENLIHPINSSIHRPTRVPSTEVKVPDWIETKATTIGYEKHLLEKILEWLDRACVLVEDILVKIFQLLQRLWRGK